MRRNLELMRTILLKVEELPVDQDLTSPLEIEGHSEDVIGEHVRLLEEANFIEAKVDVVPNWHGVRVVDSYVIFRLLNDGHDFIANAKNPTIWKKTVDFLTSKGTDVSLAVAKGVLTKMASEYLGL